MHNLGPSHTPYRHITTGPPPPIDPQLHHHQQQLKQQLEHEKDALRRIFPHGDPFGLEAKAALRAHDTAAAEAMRASMSRGVKRLRAALGEEGGAASAMVSAVSATAASASASMEIAPAPAPGPRPVFAVAPSASVAAVAASAVSYAVPPDHEQHQQQHEQEEEAWDSNLPPPVLTEALLDREMGPNESMISPAALRLLDQQEQGEGGWDRSRSPTPDMRDVLDEVFAGEEDGGPIDTAYVKVFQLMEPGAAAAQEWQQQQQQ